MATLVTDPQLAADLIAQRQANGTDKLDEVWEGVYVMSPMANDEHQYLVKELTMVLGLAIDWSGLGQTRPGTNVSDRKDDWKQNYRCPDVAVFLNETQAENCGAFWYGGPDFAIEVVSQGDRTLEKLRFYGKIHTRELLVIDRFPWQLTLFRLDGGELKRVDDSTVETPIVLVSETIPLDFQLVSEEDESVIRVMHHDGQQSWRIKVDAT